MSFLDKPLGNLSLTELRRFISQEVSRQVPPIPAGVADLQDYQSPLVRPGTSTDRYVLGYNLDNDNWEPMPVSLTSDGNIPDTPLTVTVEPGIDFFLVKWDPVNNPDPVIYDVYVSTLNGFTPASANFAGSTFGTLLSLRTDPNTSSAFIQDTTYYFVVAARDDDGTGIAAAQQSSSLAKVNSADIVANAVTASKIVAGAITAEKLEAFLVLASTIATASAGARVEFDSTGIRLYDSAGDVSMSMDAQSGTLQLRGLVNFGRDPANPSRLTNDDLLEFYEQPTGYMSPSLVQAKVTGARFGSGVVVNLATPSTKGNLLFCEVRVWRASATPPTISTPSGYTLVSSTLHAGNRMRMSTFKRENAPSASTLTVNLGSSISANDVVSVVLSEWAGVENAATAEDKKTTATGTASTTVGTGTTAATTLANEVVISSLMFDGSTTLISADPSGTIFGETYYSHTSGELSVADASVLSAYSVVSGTGAQSNSATLSTTHDSIGQIVTFKARAVTAGPGTPDSNRVRLYSKDVSATSRLHVTDDSGTESAVVLGKADQVWRMEIVTVTIDPANLASNASQTITPSIPGLLAGDYCFYLGSTSTAASQIWDTIPVCTTPGQISLKQFNANSSAVDVSSSSFEFLVIHRS